MTDPDPFLQVVEYVRNQHREIEKAAILPRPGMWRVYRDPYGWVAEAPHNSWYAYLWPFPRTFLKWEHAYAYADSRARPRYDSTLVTSRYV